jgi:ABC-type antimicrobial peptide transport system permease subunit
MPEPQYPERTYVVVGTCGDTKYRDVRDETPPQAFVPIDQFPVEAQEPGVGVMIASRDSVATVAAVRRMLQAKHPGMILQFYDFEAQLRDGLVSERMMAILSGFFGLLAALLVVVGLYGVLSYFLAQRRNEIGIRIALGASRRQVMALVMGDTATMLGIGLVVGTALALAAGREASAMLFAVKAWDPAILAGAALLLAAVTLVTSVVPALRAAHLDPAGSLRAE